VQVRRLYPDQATLPVDELARGLDFGGRAPADRPFVAVNMVSSADGKATLEGRTAPMSGEADRELFHALRAHADGILVGAGTVRVERYGRVTKTPELQALRERAGVRPQALAVVVSGSLNLPAGIALLADPDSHVVVITDGDGEIEGASAQVDYIRPADLRGALARLRSEYGVRSLLCEGGPTLNGTLFRERLVDELFLTIAPAVAGAGEALTIVEGEPLLDPVGLELVSLHEAGGHLFSRYSV
jgi:riboflavin-specific deaminase-like protein